MENNQKTPAKVGELVKLLESNDLRNRAIDALGECLSAELKFWDLTKKAIVTYPDGKTRLAAAMGILAYTDGKPIERREIITRKATTLDNLKDMAKNSPELRRSMQAIVDEASVNTIPHSVKSPNTFTSGEKAKNG
jgi:hypothetical protein